ncbi:hypothetical protein HAX54_013237 [Datura stramonium]|uniref:Ethanolamine utilization protein EutN n=1 Tax=Datura stramonium TaxID=4076 RepID=A0ABS8TMZ4_DATST|nr:hypothetical protein [Datura stramonium]
MVVGVKLDSRSKELQTWALVKVARPGDHVVVVHALHPNSDDNTILCGIESAEKSKGFLVVPGAVGGCSVEVATEDKGLPAAAMTDLRL